VKEFKYFQFASPFSSSRLITTADNVDSYWDESRDMDTGRSWQFFDDSLLHYVKYNNDSPSGYQGKSDSPIIPIDIDNTSTRNLIDVLNKLGDVLGDLEQVSLYYSGKKGYHIEIPSSLFALNPSDNLPERMKRMVSNFDIGADLSLYKQNQLYRMNNSLNVSGGHYKTQINIEKIIAGINLQEIQYLAKNPNSQSFELFEPPYVKERDWLVDLWEQTECPDNTKLKVSGGVNEGGILGGAYFTVWFVTERSLYLRTLFSLSDSVWFPSYPRYLKWVKISIMNLSCSVGDTPTSAISTYIGARRFSII